MKEENYIGKELTGVKIKQELLVFMRDKILW
jgi:hypothetical protein